MTEVVPKVKSAHVLGSDIFAGALTALVFYAEYIGYGATLGSVLLGTGATGKAIGTMMIFGAVFACSLGCFFTKGAVLAGPRAASVLALAAAVKFTSEFTDVGARTELIPLWVSTIVIISAVVQLAGLNAGVRQFFKNLPIPLTRGFIFASAASIVAGMAEKYVAACMASNFYLTMFIFCFAVTVGVVWPLICSRFSKMNGLRPLSLPIAAGVAWFAFESTQTQFLGASANQCNTLGSAGFEWIALFNRWPIHLKTTNLTMEALLVPLSLAALCGVLLGLVMLIENLTALESLSIQKAGDAASLSEADWSKYMVTNSVVNIGGAFFGFACSTWSTSRSVALRQAQASGNVAAVSHGIALIAIALMATSVMAKLPVLSIGVALTLVAIQMVDEREVRGVWASGFDGSASSQKRQAVWWFLIVLLLYFVTKQAIVALVIGWTAYWFRKRIYAK